MFELFHFLLHAQQLFLHGEIKKDDKQKSVKEFLICCQHPADPISNAIIIAHHAFSSHSFPVTTTTTTTTTNLETVSQSWQRFTDVVSELLIENTLKVGRSHSLGHMAVGWVAEEEFALGRYSHFNVFASVDILLATVDHTDVAAPQRQQLVLQNVSSIRSFVHQIQLGDDTNCSQTCATTAR